MGPVGLYVHIPFCVSKCTYCDFLSYALKTDTAEKNGFSADRLAVYKDALLNELAAARSAFLSGFPIDTVYIGGGTPTALPAPFLSEILQEIRAFSLTENAEFTVEANPGTLDGEKLLVLKEAGVNRLSIGLQAWQDDLLKTIGRIHTRQEFCHNFHAARAMGFQNINIDLMFALPGQTMEDWRITLQETAALKPEHIAAYSLSLAENTRLYAQVEKGTLILPDDETDRRMYHYGNAFLTAQGYTHYELSNYALSHYAKGNYESRHNIRYWKRSPYVGFGLGAHSFDGHMRWHNTEDLSRYTRLWRKSWEVQPLAREEEMMVTAEEAMAETMFLGLRLLRGVSEADFFNTYGVSVYEMYGEPIARLIGERLLEKSAGYIRLTPLGLDLANRVFRAFI